MLRLRAALGNSASAVFAGRVGQSLPTVSAVATHRAIVGSCTGMFAATRPDLAWWNFTTESKSRVMTLAGGMPKLHRPRNATHRIYFKKFRRGAFPNRRRQHLAVVMKGPHQQRPVKVPWPFDVSSMIFNQSLMNSDTIGYVVGGSTKTAYVTVNKLVYYPKYNQKVARPKRFFAHDEDMACVPGDLVHMRKCRRISKYKNHYIFSILEPNVEGRERLKLGLPAVPPPLFGYPTNRRVVKMNLSSQEGTKRKAAAALQEQLQDFYRFAGRVTDNAPSRLEDDGDSYDDVARMIAPNAAPTDLEGVPPPEMLADAAPAPEYDVADVDTRNSKGEDTWMRREPAEKYDYRSFAKSA